MAKTKGLKVCILKVPAAGSAPGWLCSLFHQQGGEQQLWVPCGAVLHPGGSEVQAVVWPAGGGLWDNKLSELSGWLFLHAEKAAERFRIQS